MGEYSVMATQVQQRRGTTAQHNVFTGANGEVTVDTSKDTLVIHDGTTQGGFPLAKEASVLPLAGGTMTGDVSLGTNVKARFGAGNDLQIYHSGTHSFIEDKGTGNLYIDGSSSVVIRGETNNTISAIFNDNGAVVLKNNGDTKLATTSTGIDVTGKVNGLEINTTATSNLGLGTSAVDSITTGDYNVGVGDYALGACTGGSRNTASGMQALITNTTGNYNVANGMSSLRYNITGSGNTASGYEALYYNTTGNYNTATGLQALNFNTTGNYNTANGGAALYNNTTGANNTANGYNALNASTTASLNTAVGSYSLYSNTTASYNTAIGRSALYSNTTGANNTALGYAAGENITTGSSNIIIGANVDAPSASASNQLNIGGWITGAAGAITVPGSLTTAGFTSTGIDDNATSTKLTVADTGIDATTHITSTGMFKAHSSSSGDYVRMYGSAGTGKWDIYGHGANLRISDNESAGFIHLARHVGAGTAGNADARLYAQASTVSSENIVGIRIYNHSFYPSFGLNCINPDTTTRAGKEIYFSRNGSTVGSIQTGLSSTTYNTSSDYRLKENVVPMTSSIDRLKALKPVNFNFIADATTKVDGFLAHEAGEVVPECVTGDKDAMKDEEYEVTPAVWEGQTVKEPAVNDGDTIIPAVMEGGTLVTEAVMGTRSVPDYQGIDQSKLVPLLVASLQEAIARIEVLENA